MLARFRPSPALVVACAALIVALGGTTYAAITLPKNSVGTTQLKTNAVTSPKIKNGTIVAKKVKKHTITGTEIKLSKLGTVPKANHANSADTATNARNANTVGGKQVKQFFFKGGPSSGGGTILSLDGIVIKAGCNASTNPTATVENDSGIGAEFHGAVENNTSPATVNAIFDSSLTTADNILSTFTLGSGHFTVALSNGVVVSVLFSFDNPTTFNGENVCTVNGSAIAS